MDPALARSLWHRLELVNAVAHEKPSSEPVARVGRSSPPIVRSHRPMIRSQQAGRDHKSRGWSSDDWAQASSRLSARGLLSDGPTARGRSLREKVEQRTDELATVPYATIGAERIEHMLDLMDPIIDRLAASGEVLFPNPMGLPAR